MSIDSMLMLSNETALLFKKHNGIVAVMPTTHVEHKAEEIFSMQLWNLSTKSTIELLRTYYFVIVCICFFNFFHRRDEFSPSTTITASFDEIIVRRRACEVWRMFRQFGWAYFECRVVTNGTELMDNKYVGCMVCAQKSSKRPKFIIKLITNDCFAFY